MEAGMKKMIVQGCKMDTGTYISENATYSHLYRLI